MLRSVYIGFDPREAAAFAVARNSVNRNLARRQIPVMGLVLSKLIDEGLYTRPTEMRVNSDGKRQFIDTLSVSDNYKGWLSTEHANVRFLVPHLARLQSRVGFKPLNEKATRFVEGSAGWALFMDGDMLARTDVSRPAERFESGKAIYCVHHNHVPTSGVKMDGQVQTQYGRKNWSSFVYFNCDHPSNRNLTLEMVNTLPGRDLHRFCWLQDDEIGELGPEWNYLVGHSDPAVVPKVIHFTDGVPDMPGYEDAPFADEWRRELASWAA